MTSQGQFQRKGCWPPAFGPDQQGVQAQILQRDRPHGVGPQPAELRYDAIIGVILGLCSGYIRVILDLYSDYIRVILGGCESSPRFVRSSQHLSA